MQLWVSGRWAKWRILFAYYTAVGADHNAQLGWLSFCGGPRGGVSGDPLIWTQSLWANNFIGQEWFYECRARVNNGGHLKLNSWTTIGDWIVLSAASSVSAAYLIYHEIRLRLLVGFSWWSRGLWADCHPREANKDNCGCEIFIKRNYQKLWNSYFKTD